DDADPPADAQAPAAPAAKPNKKLAGETTFAILSSWQDQIVQTPASEGRDRVLAAVAPTVKEISQLPASERDKAAASALERLDFAADSIDSKSEPPDTVRMINDGAAYLNTTAGRPDKGLEFAQKAVDFDPDDR